MSFEIVAKSRRGRTERPDVRLGRSGVMTIPKNVLKVWYDDGIYTSMEDVPTVRILVDRDQKCMAFDPIAIGDYDSELDRKLSGGKEYYQHRGTNVIAVLANMNISLSAIPITDSSVVLPHRMDGNRLIVDLSELG